MLKERICQGSNDQLTRVRPFALTSLWAADRLEVLRLFLRATSAGLFRLRWELMCPTYQVPKADSADAMVRVCEQERVDLVVVGNVGMRDRAEFLLGSVPNRVSHHARCSVVIVNTAPSDAPDGTAARKTAQAGAEPSEGQLPGHAVHAAQVFTRYGLQSPSSGPRRYC